MNLILLFKNIAVGSATGTQCYSISIFVIFGRSIWREKAFLAATNEVGLVSILFAGSSGLRLARHSACNRHHPRRSGRSYWTNAVDAALRLTYPVRGAFPGHVG
jgi:hypothetical protein